MQWVSSTKLGMYDYPCRSLVTAAMLTSALQVCNDGGEYACAPPHGAARLCSGV